ncbi:MAG: hypothetical protein K0U23_04715 [Gammaproteobacteria bacterium]|nr:hypothetical protein [Gammaproteobacteria bacterium]
MGAVFWYTATHLKKSQRRAIGKISLKKSSLIADLAALLKLKKFQRRAIGKISLKNHH